MSATPEQLEFRKRWAEALRSREYSQTRGCLHDDQGYCCIGVAAKVLDPGYDVPDYFTDDDPMFCRIQKLLACRIHHFTRLNDIEKRTFPQIADRIETDLPLFTED